MKLERFFKLVTIFALVFLTIDRIQTYREIRYLLDTTAKTASRTELLILAADLENAIKSSNTNFIAIFTELKLSWNSNTNKTR